MVGDLGFVDGAFRAGRWVCCLAVRAPACRIGASRLGRTSCSTRRTRSIHGPLTPLYGRPAPGASVFPLRCRRAGRKGRGEQKQKQKPSSERSIQSPTPSWPLLSGHGWIGCFGSCLPVAGIWRDCGAGPFRDRRRHGCRLRASMDGFTACPEKAPPRSPRADHEQPINIEGQRPNNTARPRKASRKPVNPAIIRPPQVTSQEQLAGLNGNPVRRRKASIPELPPQR